MTLIILQADVEELRANRTIMDSLTDALSRFCDMIPLKPEETEEGEDDDK